MQALIDTLVGTWVGRGDGGYPTIEPFEYREVLEFRAHPDHPALHYEQRTWRLDPAGEAVSHWETGLLRLSRDGSARLFNAQAGRAEYMEGTWAQEGGSWSISLLSSGYAGDERVISSSRALRVSRQSLEYQMHMATTATRETSLHLRATLAPQDP